MLIKTAYTSSLTVEGCLIVVHCRPYQFKSTFYATVASKQAPGIILMCISSVNLGPRETNMVLIMYIKEGSKEDNETLSLWPIIQMCTPYHLFPITSTTIHLICLYLGIRWFHQFFCALIKHYIVHSASNVSLHCQISQKIVFTFSSK